jgi:hypothetical protein
MIPQTDGAVQRRLFPHSPTPLSHPSAHPCRGERGSREGFLFFSLFSPGGWVEGWEKRAGVMRAHGMSARLIVMPMEL